MLIELLVIYRYVASICNQTTSKPKSFKPTTSPMPKNSNAKENEIPSCITKEWEQLVILDDDESTRLPVNLKFKSDATNSKILTQSKPMDEKTTRILERLEPPKPKRQQKKDTLAAPVNDVAGQMKRPLLPFDTNSNLNLTQSQPMRPNFQRMKKKQKT
jgi:hypothetical protein